MTVQAKTLREAKAIVTDTSLLMLLIGHLASLRIQLLSLSCDRQVRNLLRNRHLVLKIAQQIRNNGINFLPGTDSPTDPHMGLNPLAKPRARILKVDPVFTRSMDTPRVKEAGSRDQLAPWSAELGFPIAKNNYPPTTVCTKWIRGQGLPV